MSTTMTIVSPRYRRKPRLAELRKQRLEDRGSFAAVIGVLACLVALIGFGGMAIAGADSITAGDPCYTAAEYRSCFPSKEQVWNNFVAGMWMFGISAAIAALCLLWYRYARRELRKS